MALMFPDIDTLGNITHINESELEFYRLLKNSPYTKNWKVFYSWVIRAKYTLREVDFIIFIEGEGIVLVELKANNPVKISKDEFIYNYNGFERITENPFRKIKNITHQFKTILNLDEDEKRDLFVSGIIVFPNLNYDFNEEICFDRFNYINSRIKYEEIPLCISLYFNQKKQREINRIGFGVSPQKTNKVMEKIYLDFLKVDNTHTAIGMEDLREVEKKAKRQLMNYFYTFSNFKRLLIDAPSSGGKSFLALQEILNRREDNFKIGYVCSSKGYLNKMIYSFHKTNVDISSYSTIDRGLKKQTYDMLILDDFNFNKKIISTLDGLLKGGIKKGNIWILCDSEKNENEISTFINEYNFENSYIKLPFNFKNNIAISNLVNKVLKKDVYIDSFFEYYNEVEFIGYTQDNFEKKLQSVLNRLTDIEKFKSNEIKIISFKEINDSSLSKLISHKKWQRWLKPYYKAADEDLAYAFIDDFSGLDSRAVILIDLDKSITNIPLQLYKGVTRARQRLVIMHNVNLDINSILG